jgi:hypothetical protein
MDPYTLAYLAGQPSRARLVWFYTVESQDPGSFVDTSPVSGGVYKRKAPTRLHSQLNAACTRPWRGTEE